MINLDPWGYVWAYPSGLVTVLAKANVLENKVFCPKFTLLMLIKSLPNIKSVEGVVRVIHRLIYGAVNFGETEPTPVHSDELIRV